MPLSWNEIRHRAITFAKEWKSETREAAERQTFWNEFFNVFGVRRRTVATFDEPVKKLSGDWGFIDLFWPGRLLAEHKSAGEDLGKAHAQGMAYIRGLKDTGRDREIPRWLIVSDFNRIALHDLEPEQDPDAPLLKRLPPTVEFPLADFHKHVHRPNNPSASKSWFAAIAWDLQAKPMASSIGMEVNSYGKQNYGKD
ncbi:MAG: hypothetical protein HY674_04685 [Chloroflexi bacterium]|nr:hypothetical protein [Chloroflexota bacterium]